MSEIFNSIKVSQEVKDEVDNIFKKEKVPIYKGCKVKMCYCTGECKKIIGYRDKHILER